MSVEGDLFAYVATPEKIAEKARKAERERIIALLDESFIYDEPVVVERQRLIALIKGESE